MEFLAGSFVMAVALLSFYWLIQNKMDRNIPVPRHSQARAFALASEKIILDWQYDQKTVKETQASLHLEKSQVRVVIHNNTAYWIQDKNFLTAKLVNGNVDPTTTRPVDTMSMDKTELENISLIVEKLTEGKKDDRWNSGNPKL